MARKLLFIGRDGALLERGRPGRIENLENLRLMPGAIPALLRLVGAGYELIVLDDTPAEVGSNGAGTLASGVDSARAGTHAEGGQADAGDPAGRARVDAFLEALLASQGVRFAATLRCEHAGSPDCGCRKPGLGLVRAYLVANAMDRERSAVVGDTAADLGLAANMGLEGFLLEPGCVGPGRVEPGRETPAGGLRGAAAGGPDGAPRTEVMSWSDVAHVLLDRPRIARLTRRTRETDIEVEIDLDREAEPRVATGIGFFDHMLEQLGKHAGIALAVTCRGDLEIDEHHTVEDVALALGQAFKQALGDKRGIGRYGFVLPMDEAEAEVSIDLGGRPYFVFEGAFGRERVGGLPTELVPHFFRSLAESLGAAVHVKLRGENAHHMVEASFKGLARALRQACARAGETLPTTKGVL